YAFRLSVVGSYLCILDRGGMGVVYAACRADKRFEQKLAIKVIHKQLALIFDETALFSEAQMLAKLNHPHIAKVFDGGVYNQQVYIVMEQVDGGNLSCLCQQQELDSRQKIELLLQVCQAIEYSHAQGIVHGDLKPENVLVDVNMQAKIIDFNLTQKLSANEGAVTALSPYYASPEQKSGAKLEPASDIFALGKLLEWLFLTKKTPTDLTCIIQKATQIRPEQRYQTAYQLRLDLENTLNKRPISQRKGNIPYVYLRMFQRHPISSSLTVTLMLTAVIFTSVVLNKNKQLEHEKSVAENLIYEVTSMMFHSKSSAAQAMPVSAVLDHTRRRILSNPQIPKHIKQKMFLVMIEPEDQLETLEKRQSK
ncbi:serine/threonine-protein kinase, partial [Vibrio ponticus]|uniref:serine/threonine-protein kinase n=1 Tax=Vibrio ponticus TaxID=265668 RepID=UPI0011151E19